MRNHYDPTCAESEIVWASSDESVATVDSNGLIVGTGFGETTISATCGGTTVSTKVTVPMIAEQQVSAFVERMYTVALEREAEKNGLEFYVRRLIDGDSNGACLAGNLLQKK